MGLSGFLTPLQGVFVSPVLAASGVDGREARGVHERRADMPSSEVELYDAEEALDGVVDGGEVEEHLGMAHETVAKRERRWSAREKRRERTESHFVILSSMLLGSRIKVGKTTRLRSAPGRSWEMMWERTARGEVCMSARVDRRRPGRRRRVIKARGYNAEQEAKRGGSSPLPWSGSMTWVSSSVSAARASSAEERLLAAGGENQVNMVACTNRGAKVRNEVCANAGREE